MVWCVCAVCGRPAFPGLIMAAWPLPGPGGYGAANRIDRPINAMAQGGIIPGETVRAVRLRAWLGKAGELVKRLCACAQSGGFAPKVAAKVAQFCAKVADSR